MRKRRSAAAGSEGDPELSVERQSFGWNADQLREVHECVVSLVYGHLTVRLVRPVSKLHAAESELIHEVFGFDVLPVTVVFSDPLLVSGVEVDEFLPVFLVLLPLLKVISLDFIAVLVRLFPSFEGPNDCLLVFVLFDYNPWIFRTSAVSDLHQLVGRHFTLRLSGLLCQPRIGKVVDVFTVLVEIALRLFFGLEDLVAEYDDLSRDVVDEPDRVVSLPDDGLDRIGHRM